MKWRQARGLAALAIGCSAFLMSGCSEKVTMIGAVVPISGEDSTYGIAVKNGIELAFEEIQAEEGYTPALELKIVDSESDPEKAKTHTSELYSEGALLLMGGVTSAEAKVMVSVADEYDRVLISPSASSPDLSGLSRSFYRIFPSDFAAASRMAQFVSQDLKIEEVVVVAEEREYAKGIQNAFRTAYENLGGSVMEVIEFPTNTSEFSGLMERVLTLEPKAVYLTAYGQEVGAMVQALRKEDYKGKILTTSAFASPNFIVPVGEDAAGVILTQSVFELDSDHAHIKTFAESYQAKFGEAPDIYAAHGYDTMKVVAEALRGRAPLPSEVPKGLRDVKDFPGVTGSISFNEKGDVLKYPRIYIISRDLVLQDYNERVRKQQDEIRKRREELKKKLDAINQQAKQMSDG